MRFTARSCGGVPGLVGDSGAATCPRPMGGSPPVASAAAGPLPRTRRQAVPAATFPQRRARTDNRAVLRSPGSLSPVKDHSKGRAYGASLTRWRSAPPLTDDLPRPDPGTYQEDGGGDGDSRCSLPAPLTLSASRACSYTSSIIAMNSFSRLVVA